MGVGRKVRRRTAEGRGQRAESREIRSDERDTEPRDGGAVRFGVSKWVGALKSCGFAVCQWKWPFELDRDGQDVVTCQPSSSVRPAIWRTTGAGGYGNRGLFPARCWIGLGAFETGLVSLVLVGCPAG